MTQEPVVAFSSSRRAGAKQLTRRRLITAAKQLAGERGYEAATLRDVAALAGLSTGAVFANFTDKADLFRAAIAEDDVGLAALMRRAAETAGSPRRTLMAMLSAAQAAQQQELAWVRVKMSLLWSCNADNARAARPVETALAEPLRAGVQAGALSERTDPALLADMAWEAYLSNCRRAVFDGWSAERLRQRLAAAVEALLDGYEIAGAANRISWPPSARALATPPRALRG
jgi:AcrR family transcriptional regulator